MTAVRERDDVVVEAPDGAAALELKRRLERLGSPEVEFAEAWSVKLPDADVHEVENEVRVWLRQIGLDSTIVETNTDEHRVYGPRHTYAPTQRDFIG